MLSIGAFIGRCWRWAGDIHLAAWLLDWFAWPKLFLSTVGGIALGVWKWVSTLSGPDTAVTTLVAFAALLLVINLILAISRKIPRFSSLMRRRLPSASLSPGLGAIQLEVSYDWPIRSLFAHVAPGTSEGRGGAWDKVCRDIIDRFSAGQLSVWGREIEDSQRSSLALIPADRWKHATLTDSCLKEEYASLLHAECKRPARGSRPWQFADLWVNKTQAFSIWPEPEHISLPDAARVLYGEMAETAFGKLTKSHCDSEDEILDAMASTLSNRATIRGVRPGSSKIEIVRPADKRYSRIIGGARTYRDNTMQSRIMFKDLEISRSELNRVIGELKAMEGE